MVKSGAESCIRPLPLKSIRKYLNKHDFFKLMAYVSMVFVDALCLGLEVPDLEFTLRDWREKVVSRLTNML